MIALPSNKPLRQTPVTCLCCSVFTDERTEEQSNQMTYTNSWRSCRAGFQIATHKDRWPAEGGDTGTLYAHLLLVTVMAEGTTVTWDILSYYVHTAESKQQSTVNLSICCSYFKCHFFLKTRMYILLGRISNTRMLDLHLYPPHSPLELLCSPGLSTYLFTLLYMCVWLYIFSCSMDLQELAQGRRGHKFPGLGVPGGWETVWALGAKLRSLQKQEVPALLIHM